MDFYEYENRIISTFTKMGFSVTSFHDRNYRSIFSRTVQRVNQKSQYTANKNYEYQMCFLNQLENEKTDFDVILVVVGHFLSESFLDELKTRYKSACFILYLWDDVARLNCFEKKKVYFDYIFSFDPSDCDIYNFIFRPLFFTNDYIYGGQNKDILLYASGWDHSNRVEMINNILKKAGDSAADMKFYIYSSPFKQLARRIKHRDFGLRPDYIHYCRMPMVENAEYTKRSSCLLDVQYISQGGLSLRSFECLAAQTKIITTNEKIKDYDFYDPQNVLIIPRSDDFEINFEFLTSPFKEIPQEIVNAYSLDSWSKCLLSGFVKI